MADDHTTSPELLPVKVPNPRHPEGAARITLSAALGAAGSSWEELADAIENGTNYENDTITVSIALRALQTAFEYEASQPQSPDTSLSDAVTDELRWHVARAISIPQHHTTWDTLTEREKDLFYMQADYAIAAMKSKEQSND